jgi:hypothetical protein
MLKRILFVFVFFILGYSTVIAQPRGAQQKKISKPIRKKNLAKLKYLATKLNGQWRGFFGSNGDIVVSGTDNTEYVLELDIQGTDISGYSYSYFQDRSYYVICSLAGELDEATQTITVTETARIKGSTPPGWADCLQTHILTYKKEGTTEVLTGSWKTAPGQIGNCGFGSTTLIRRTLSKNLTSYNTAGNSSTPYSSPKHTTKAPSVTHNNKTNPPIVKVVPKPETPIPAELLPPQNPVAIQAPEVVKPMPENQADIPITTDINFEKRNTNLLQTIKIENPTVRVDLYDNGVVDGDSISLFFNSRLILSHQRLSEKAITITLNVNTNKQVNDLTMYAENLGTIPPNTALMVVTDGEKRYEVPVTSDLQNSGTVRFIFSGEK